MSTVKTVAPVPATGATTLKNLLRSQKRLLGRLQKGKDADDGGTKTANEEEMVDGAQQRITMLEKEIVAHADREREKKNATK